MKTIKTLLSVFLLLLFGYSISYAQNDDTLIRSPFSDVDESNKYYDAILYTHENGIFEGYNDGTFRPDSYINRAEFVKIIVNTFYGYDEVQDYDRYPLSGIDFPDVEEDAWYTPFLRRGVSSGIINGYEDGKFRPSNNINFAEAAKIMAISARQDEFITNNDVWYQPYVDYVEKFDSIPDSIETYDQLVTRAETAQMIYDLSQNGAINGDSFENIQANPIEDAESIILEGMNKFTEVSSLKYNVSIVVDSYVPNLETMKFTIDGSLDALDKNNFSFLTNFDILYDAEDNNQYVIKGHSLFTDNSIYLYLNENNLINRMDSDYYLHKWWQYSLDYMLDQSTEQKEGIVPSADIGNFGVFENIKYLGKNLVMGEESYHYAVEIDEDEFKNYIFTVISNSGGVISDEELDNIANALTPENTRIELWIGASSHILTKAKLAVIEKNDAENIGKIDILFAFSDFNKPLEFVIPDAEEIMIDKMYYLIFGVDIFESQY